MAILSADTIAAPLSPSESLSDPMMEFRRILKMPLFAKRLMASLLRMLSRPAGRNDAFAALSEVLHPMSVAEERALVLKREEQKAAWTKAFKDQGVDFILTIAHPLPPVPRGKSGTATLLSASSAFLFNVVSPLVAWNIYIFLILYYRANSARLYRWSSTGDFR